MQFSEDTELVKEQTRYTCHLPGINGQSVVLCYHLYTC